MDAETLDLQRRALLGAETDREDADAPLGRRRCRFERIRPLVVLAVGEQDDRRRGMRPGRHDRWQRIRIRRAVRVVAGLGVPVGRRDRRQRRDDAACDRCPAFRAQPVDRRQDLRLVGGRHEHREAGVTERDDADKDVRRLAGDERPSCGLGRFHAARIHVRGGHAAGDVERQDDRPLEPWDADDTLGSGECQDEDRHPGEQQGCRDPASQRTAAAAASRWLGARPAARQAHRSVVDAAPRAGRRARHPTGWPGAAGASTGQRKVTPISVAAGGAAWPSARWPGPGRRRSIARPRRRRLSGMHPGASPLVVPTPRGNDDETPCHACRRRAARRSRRPP